MSTSDVLAVADPVVGAVLVVAGGSAWRLRPASRAGIIMVAAGASWFAGSVVGAAVYVHRGSVIHLQLSYPPGRLRRPAAVAVVTVANATSLLVVLARNSWLTLALALLVAITALDVFARSSGPARKAGGPALASALAFAAVLAFSSANRLGWPRRRHPAQREDPRRRGTPGGPPMKVVIADDSTLMRQGLARLLEDAGCDVLATAADADGLLREVALTQPDAAIVDIRMPPTHTDEGITAAHRLRTSHPAMGVLVLSQYLEADYAMRLITDAPQHLGYLLKDRVSDVVVLVDALQRLIDGECVIDPTIVSRLIHRPRDPGPLDRLTARERQVLALMAEGRSNAAIAQRISMSHKTLETHIRQILQKLNLPESADSHRRVLAVLTYLRS